MFAYYRNGLRLMLRAGIHALVCMVLMGGPLALFVPFLDGVTSTWPFVAMVLVSWVWFPLAFHWACDLTGCFKSPLFKVNKDVANT